ncbi:helix-turn-helix transcriptional regulator [Weissella diestrammenae]|uniref:Helix-turn-helix transcriptional regulator n=1 Tax=Weissella diestrammenae TaxID=1162633 RepID=A0A7G9T4F9_9LACO|nr:helix-turn-helix transcriptional regulator [Weissella diestrammenae]MCM0583520.1 helix-turn-helix transcriptional regulator [Weissella diestrammenae]QNN74984.1 helix-turn-helix transcriptional regulator [Weissella diestrammenae]
MSELEMAVADLRIKFKKALLENDMKQIELARILDVAPAQISRALAGNTTPKDIEIQRQVAKILKIKL